MSFSAKFDKELKNLSLLLQQTGGLREGTLTILNVSKLANFKYLHRGNRKQGIKAIEQSLSKI
jgi:hypothetical protein